MARLVVAERSRLRPVRSTHALPLVLAALATAVPRPTLLDAQEYDVCESPGALSDWLQRHSEAKDRFAPEFVFSPGERYLPTMSFFTALDEVDNDGDGAVDFADPDEIAALRDGRPSWGALDDAYGEGGGNRPPIELGAIYYQVRPLSEDGVSDMWRFLVSDEQAWRRFDIDRDAVLRRLHDPATRFLVIDYHAYYINDLGLIGHNYDTEYVRMFVPEDPALADLFRIYVGAGHTDRVPNNVLVLSGQNAVRENGDPPGVLVELGDHSSAPDIRPRGAFAPGYDANWHAHDLWGTRDVQSSSGLGALGKYETWMTYPRDHEVAPAALTYAPVQIADVMEQTQQRLKLVEETAPAEEAGLDEGHIGQYRLIAARGFECLFDEIDDYPDVDRVQAWLDLAHPDFGDAFAGLSPAQQAEAVRAMARWREGLHVDGNEFLDREKVLIWESKHYGSEPADAFKQHLFRPVFGALNRFGHWLDLFHIWVTWQPGRGAMVQAGFEVPAFHMPIRLPGYLEAQAGIYSSCRDLVNSCGARGESLAVSLLHTWHYNRPLTWYNRLTWIPEREQAEGDPTAADWLVGGGLSLTLSVFRLRIGLSSDFHWKSGPQLGDTFWEIVLSRL